MYLRYEGDIPKSRNVVPFIANVKRTAARPAKTPTIIVRARKM